VRIASSIGDPRSTSASRFGFPPEKKTIDAVAIRSTTSSRKASARRFTGSTSAAIPASW
jgi:hypothetical protein